MFHKEGSKIIFITLLVSVGLIFLADALVKDNLWLLKSIQIAFFINFDHHKINTSFLTDMTQSNPDKKKLQFIDAHHHFWDLEKNDYPWLNDHPEPNFFLGINILNQLAQNQKYEPKSPIY